jgi:hypothetical protein
MVGNRRILKKPKNLNIMVIRINSNGELVNSRPCYQCTIMLKELEINKVYYSINNTIVHEKVVDMISINSSNSWKVVDMMIYGAPSNIPDYYKYVISKMPVDIKKNNANLFVNCIDKEFVGCNYKMTKIHLILLYEQTELGRFNLI